ncbi:MAG: patatin-like phospholipase family protein [Candidatus Sericytochromatia bacterium]
MKEKKVIKNKKKIAFVASGGAVKAACFHIGAMLAMQRFGFSFGGGALKDKNEPKAGEVSVYVGSSAGSFITALLAGGFSPEQLYESLRNNKKDVIKSISYSDMLGINLMSNINSIINSLARSYKYKNIGVEGVIQTFLGINGLFNTKSVGKYIKNNMPTNDFRNLAAELYIVGTELDNPNRVIFGPRELPSPPTKKAEYITDVPVSEAAVGSMSLPVIFGPHKMKIKGEDKYIFDGEIKYTLSTHIAKDAGADLIISSYTHQPYKFNPEYGSLINYGLTSILVQTIYQLIESKIRDFRDNNDSKEQAINDVKEFFEEKNLPKELMHELLEKMQKHLYYNPDVDYIYISPDPMDSGMFFEDFFNLSKSSMGRIIKCGFRSAYKALSEYKFDFSEGVEVSFEHSNIAV